jgi:hypothetical protein
MNLTKTHILITLLFAQIINECHSTITEISRISASYNANITKSAQVPPFGANVVRIIATGASGGSGNVNGSGGMGATVTVRYSITDPSEIFTIDPGQGGARSPWGSTGTGGGYTSVTSNKGKEVIAGGGAGAGFSANVFTGSARIYSNGHPGGTPTYSQADINSRTGFAWVPIEMGGGYFAGVATLLTNGTAIWGWQYENGGGNPLGGSRNGGVGIGRKGGVGSGGDNLNTSNIYTHNGGGYSLGAGGGGGGGYMGGQGGAMVATNSGWMGNGGFGGVSNASNSPLSVVYSISTNSIGGVPQTYTNLANGFAFTASNGVLLEMGGADGQNGAATVIFEYDDTLPLILKYPATVTLSSSEKTYTGLPIIVTATTNPPGLNVNITYNGSATPPTNVGTYTIIGTINDPLYQGVSQ